MYGAPESDDRPHPVRRELVVLALFALAAFWIWALFFASKTAINKVEDERGPERAEAICADGRRPTRACSPTQTSTDLNVRADLVEESTDLLSDMLDDIVGGDCRTDEKGQAIVPAWEADYRTLLDDRYAYADHAAQRAGRPVHRDRGEQRAGHRAHRDVRRRQRDAELRPAPRLGRSDALVDHRPAPVSASSSA